jgi:hypothetical protein
MIAGLFPRFSRSILTLGRPVCVDKEELLYSAEAFVGLGVKEIDFLPVTSSSSTRELRSLLSSWRLSDFDPNASAVQGLGI